MILGCSNFCECSKTSGSSQSSNNGNVIIPTDSSDSDKDDGCTGSPRMQRRRRRNLREKNRARTVMSDNGRNTSGNENTTEFEDLAYIDTLPEVSTEVMISQ